MRFIIRLSVVPLAAVALLAASAEPRAALVRATRSMPHAAAFMERVAKTEPLVYVSDSQGNVVDAFTINGKHVGTITMGLNKPAGVYVDASHNLWVANPGANQVLVFARGALRPSQTLSDINVPNDVALCPDGTAYVADSEGQGGVAIYPPGATQPTGRLLAVESGNGGVEYDVTCDAAGNVFASGFIGASPFNATTGWMRAKQSGYYLLPINQFYVGALKATTRGTLVIATSDNSNDAVAEYTEAGKATGRAVTTGANLWAAIALNPRDSVLFGAVPTLGRGLSVSFPHGKPRTTYESSNLVSPHGVAFDPGAGAKPTR